MGAKGDDGRDPVPVLGEPIAAEAASIRSPVEIAAATGDSIQDWRRQVIQRAVFDQQFRQELLSSPQEAIEKALGIAIPEGLVVRVVQVDHDEVLLGIPTEDAVNELLAKLEELEQLGRQDWDIPPQGPTITFDLTVDTTNICYSAIGGGCTAYGCD